MPTFTTDSPENRLLHVAKRAPVDLHIVQVVNVLDGGNHHPLLCQCSGRDGLGLWVIKPQVIESLGNRRGALDLLSELAGAEVCAWAGVDVPAIGLTRLDKSPDPSLYGNLPDPQRREVAEIFRLNGGRLAFGSRYLERAVDVVPDALNTGQGLSIVLGVGAALFALDAYIRHDDRYVENPNAVLWRDKLVAIDNGAAFVGLDKPGATGKDLAAQTFLPPHRAAKHLMYAPLRSHAEFINWIAVAQRLSSTPTEDIDQAANWWPDELDRDHLTSRAGLKKNLIDFLKARRSYANVIVEAAANMCRVAA